MWHINSDLNPVSLHAIQLVVAQLVVADLRKAAELSPEDKTIAETLRYCYVLLLEHV